MFCDSVSFCMTELQAFNSCCQLCQSMQSCILPVWQDYYDFYRRWNKAALDLQVLCTGLR